MNMCANGDGSCGIIIEIKIEEIKQTKLVIKINNFGVFEFIFNFSSIFKLGLTPLGTPLITPSNFNSNRSGIDYIFTI
jgi:hypothetical protein